MSFQSAGCDAWEAVREWNEELQYSRELPRTDANLFINQQQMRQRARIIKRQQDFEAKGAPFSMILGDEMHQLEKLALLPQQPRASSSSHNVSLFKSEDAAIIRERNLCKVSIGMSPGWGIDRYAEKVTAIVAVVVFEGRRFLSLALLACVFS